VWKQAEAVSVIHTFTQMPQPMHSSSDIHAILELGDTSMHSLPAQKPNISMITANMLQIMLIETETHRSHSL
jgi:hypothetical protein